MQKDNSSANVPGRARRNERREIARIKPSASVAIIHPRARLVQKLRPSRVLRHRVLRVRLEANVGALCVALMSGGNGERFGEGEGVKFKRVFLANAMPSVNHFSQVPISCPMFLIKRNSPNDALSFRWLLAPSYPRPNHTPLKTIGPDLP